VIVGRHGWPQRVPADASLVRLQWSMVTIVLVAGVVFLTVSVATGFDAESETGLVVTALARTWGRAALAAFYALTILRLVGAGGTPRWLRPLALAGRMPLTNYLMQTALAGSIFYGWGLGWWGRVGPATESLLAIALFVFVQLPLSAWWLSRHPFGPLELAWRRFTYARTGS
jgi:uncharacterized protein